MNGNYLDIICIEMQIIQTVDKAPSQEGAFLVS